MARTSAISAGVLVWRRLPARAGTTPGSDLQVLIVHPGGPFFANKDDGAWSIPKGECEDAVITDDALRETALRELLEETGMAPETPITSLGSVKQKSGKVVHAFAMEADGEPPKGHRPPQVRLEWPKGSMRELAFDEVDQASFVALDVARRKLNPAQVDLLDRLLNLLRRAG